MSCREIEKVFISPPSRRGRRADLTDVTLPQEIGAAGGRTLVCASGLTSLEAARCRACASRPAAPISEGSVPFLDRRGRPSSKEGNFIPSVHTCKPI